MPLTLSTTTRLHNHLVVHGLVHAQPSIVSTGDNASVASLEMDQPMFLEFRTSAGLVEVAQRLGATIRAVDHENEYEWVIADLAGEAINISRLHTGPPLDDDVHVCLDRDPLGVLPEALLRVMLAGIGGLDVTAVYVGAFLTEPGTTKRTTVRRRVTNRPAS
jgi:hypothetical protein